MSVFSRHGDADASDAAAWKTAYESGLQPIGAVGVGLFPAVSGKGGVKVRCRLREVQCRPPWADYVAVGARCVEGTGDGQVCPVPILAEIMRISDSRTLNLHGICAVQGSSTTADLLQKLVLFCIKRLQHANLQCDKRVENSALGIEEKGRAITTG